MAAAGDGERRVRIARTLLTACAGFLAIIPPLADLDASHVLNPNWTPHARLHTVWLISTTSLVALVALWQLWRPAGGDLRRAIRLAGTLIGAVLAGFFIAGATRGLYGGAFADPNAAAGTVAGLNANVAAFALHLCLVAIALALTRTARARPS